MLKNITIITLIFIFATEVYAMSNVYDYSVFTPKGEEVKLSAFKGKVLLIVNTATGCGFTPQYEQLEEMYRKYHDKGLEIIDIPCNQFGGQAPGSDDEIHEFCALHFNTTYDQFKKSEVNGSNELPLYTFLKSRKGFEGFDKGHKLTPILEDMLGKADPDFAKKPDIKWNFTKFIVDRNGDVVKRFEPTADMADVEKFAASLL
ncbi:MAG: glutathione peroxidase [Synergistaceae bacterium]|nr:glutathione peroxidase [Synergistaceae bacterium]